MYICQMTFDKYKAIDSSRDQKAIAYGLNFGILQAEMKTNEVLEKKAIWGVPFGGAALGQRQRADHLTSVVLCLYLRQM